MVDYIARLLMFDTDGSKCDTAMGLMRWNNVTGAELNARRADPNRPIYLPL